MTGETRGVQIQEADGRLLAAALAEGIKPILGYVLQGQRGRALGVTVESEQRIHAAWALLLEHGHGHLLIEEIVAVWELETSEERRRRSVRDRIRGLVDNAGVAELAWIEGLLDEAERRPKILTPEMDDEVLSLHQAAVLASHEAEEAEVILRLPQEWCERTGIRIIDSDGWVSPTVRDWTAPITRGDFLERAQRSTTSAWPQPLLDEGEWASARRRVDCWRCGAEIRWVDDEHAKAWIHLSSNSPACYLHGEGDSTAMATPHDEPF